jgi:hypothetical protein
MNIRTALFALACAAPAAWAQEHDITKLQWLSGCWKADAAEAGSVEQWMPLAGGSLLGMGRTVKGGKTVAWEFMRIDVQPGGRLAFHAQPSGQPPATFPATSLSDTEVVFENPQHDFPQRVVYARDGATRLAARIEGQRNGKLRTIAFPMQRVSCDSLLPETPR